MNLDERIEREIISAARRFNVKRVILFGSRARGTNRPRSDIDIAITGGDFFNFTAAVNEEIDTLLKFDVVNLDEKISDEFKAEIARDGIILFEEVSPAVKKFDAFAKCLKVLLAADKNFSDELYRMGIIGQFHLTFELSWKALREILIVHGVNEASTGSPREILKAGYQFHFIDDEKLWLEMLRRRNQSAHVYDDKIADELIALIFDRYIAAFVELRDEICRRSPLDNHRRDDCQNDQKNSD